MNVWTINNLTNYLIFFSTFEENYEQVSSSTENYRRVTEEPGMHELDQPYSDSVEKVCILSKHLILQHVSCFSAVLSIILIW